MLRLPLPKPYHKLLPTRTEQEIKDRIGQLKENRQKTKYAAWQAMMDCRVDELEWTLKKHDAPPAAILTTPHRNGTPTEIPHSENSPVRTEQELRERIMELESEKPLTRYSPWLDIICSRIGELKWVLREKEE